MQTFFLRAGDGPWTEGGLAGLAVPRGDWLPITPRSAYLDATEYDPRPVAWLWWEDGHKLAVQNSGQIPLWLIPERDSGNVVVVEPTDQLTVPADGPAPRWTVHFGHPSAAHRLLRFFRVRRRKAER